MSYDFVTTTSALLRNDGTPWGIAPAPIKKALAAIEKAQAEHTDAITATQDAEIETPAVQAKWDADAKAAVKAGKPLPSRDDPDRAKFVLELAREEARTAEQNLNGALGTLASSIELGPDLRQEWLDAIDARTDTLRTEIRTAADTIAPAVAELNALLGTGLFVAQWRTLLNVPAPITSDPVNALHAAANTRGHLDLTGNITA